MLVVALSASLACQAAYASPMAPLSVGNGFSGGELLATLWSWFTKAEALGGRVAVNVRGTSGSSLRKAGSISDPNGGANDSKPCQLGTGGSPVALQP
jgi:hypothetical protein